MILDANAWLGEWPFANLEPDQSRELVAHQAARAINLSCVARIEGAFYLDPAPANERLYRELRDHPTMAPVAILNPTMANWPKVLERAVQQGCRQIRLIPNYHQYALDDPRCEALLDAARDAGLRVGLQVRMEDERHQHPLMKVAGVPVAQIAELAARRPTEQFLALCCYQNEVIALREQGNLLFELSHVEYLDTLDHLLERVPAAQVVFGSHTPFFTTWAGLVKVEQSRADGATRRAVAGGNLADWLGGAREVVPWVVS
ncbi:MAG: hypothetical protein HUU35_06825 [Armatimonadetes bacterium]|nr:hypothetical protein [Armatimonadota bacterium]